MGIEEIHQALEAHEFGRSLFGGSDLGMGDDLHRFESGPLDPIHQAIFGWHEKYVAGFGIAIFRKQRQCSIARDGLGFDDCNSANAE